VFWLLPEMEDLELGASVDLAVRPERLELLAAGAVETLAGSIHERRYAGPVTWYGVTLDHGGEIEVLGAPDAAAPGDRVGVGASASGPPVSCFTRSSVAEAGESGER
jgi:hypothetical protein